MHQVSQQDAYCSFQSREAARGVHVLPVLFLLGMRGMVSDDAVNSAIQKACQHRIHILLLPEWRIYLGGAVKKLYQIIRHGQVLRRNLGSYLDAPCLGLAHDIHGPA